MGRLLQALMAETQPAPVATPATLATLGRNVATVATVARPTLLETGEVSQLSQLSQGPDTQALRAHLSAPLGAISPPTKRSNLRARLSALAAQVGTDADLVHRLSDADIKACAGLDDETLRRWLCDLPSITEREAGRIPRDYTARAVCDGCGAVAVHPGTIERAPVGEAWPRLTSCPWCLYRLRTGKHPPRPVADRFALPTR